MKKVKQKDGAVKEVEDTYSLVDGESFVEPTINDAFRELTANVAEALKAIDAKIDAYKPKETEEEKFQKRVDEEVRRRVTEPVNPKAFAPTSPQGLQTTRRTFGLKPETDVMDRMTLAVCAVYRQKMNGDPGPYKDFMKFTTMTEGTDATLGYLVVESFDTEIIASLPKYGTLLRYINIRPAPPTDTINLTGLLTGPTVSVVSEASAISANTSLSLSRPTVSIKTGLAYLTLSNQLLQDAPTLRPYLPTLFGEAMAKKIETDMINGTNQATEFGTGYFSTSNAVVEATATSDPAASLNYNDFVDAEANFDDNDKDGAVYGMHKSFKAIVRKIKDDNSRPIFQNTMATSDGAAREVMSINGYPLFTSKAFPSYSTVNGNLNTAFGFLVNPTRITHAFSRLGMTFDLKTSGTDPDGVNHNSTFTSGLQVAFRFGFTHHVPVDINAEATGLVVLKTPTS